MIWREEFFLYSTVYAEFIQDSIVVMILPNASLHSILNSHFFMCTALSTTLTLKDTKQQGRRTPMALIVEAID
jgi:hypothetical protein